MAINAELKARLMSDEFGLNEEQVGKLETAGLKEATDFSLLTGQQIAEIAGVGIISAMKIGQAFAPAPTALPTFVSPDAVHTNGDDSGKATPPSKAEVTSFAGSMGIDPNMLTMLLLGNLGGGNTTGLSVSGLIPWATLLPAYKPRNKDIPYQVLAALENQLRAEFIIINSDGSINRELTAKYIESLEMGYEAMPDGVYTAEDGSLYEIVGVGVDAQSIADADPLNSAKALQQTGLGIGRVNWSGVGLDVRQTVFLAVNVTKEISPTNEAHLQWLRDHIKPGVNRLALNGQAAKAVTAYSEAYRTGSLPTLRVMLGRGPRRQEVTKRRSFTSPRDLSEARIKANDPFDNDRL